MRRISIIIGILCSILISACLFAGSLWTNLEYKPSPVDNPLKGLVPYFFVRGVDFFPHSMEYNSMPVSSVVIGAERYDWNALEDFLNKTGKRGMQAVIRFYLEYPGKPSGVPDYIKTGGLKFIQYERPKTGRPEPTITVETPDWNDQELRNMMTGFIRAFGKKYDGDPRLGFIEAGLLGHWGEWHDQPRNDLFASKQVQSEIMDAYEKSFHITPILVRYPAGNGDSLYASNAERPFGYHDDSFTANTLPGPSYYFVPRLTKAGESAINKWKSQPIGGEIRPENWGIVFDELKSDSKVQDFKTCVAATHATWMQESGMFKKQNPDDRQARAIKMVQGMGYEFFVSQVMVTIAASKQLTVSSRIENKGVAPFYYNWPAEYALINSNGRIIKTKSSKDNFKGLLPGSEPRAWSVSFDVNKIPPGVYRVLVRVQNTLPKGNVLRFANAEQDADIPGWLTLVKEIKL